MLKIGEKDLLACAFTELNGVEQEAALAYARAIAEIPSFERPKDWLVSETDGRGVVFARVHAEKIKSLVGQLVFGLMALENEEAQPEKLVLFPGQMKEIERRVARLAEALSTMKEYKAL